MLLSDILRRENNNLDIFRVIAAFMVIFGHAYAILPFEGQKDILGRLLVFDYSGSLAVKIFFFLSGLVVTNSLLNKKDIRSFLVSRFFRIWPALTVVLVVWAFVLGPLFSTQSFLEYFSNPEIYGYFPRSLLMDMRYDLPGVFQGNALKAVNGSLWTIPFEVYAYITLTATYLLGVTNSKRLSVLLFLVFLVDPIIGRKLIFTWLPPNPEITLLAPCFAFGSLCAIFKNEIEINIAGLVGVWTLYYLFSPSTYNFYFFYLATFYSIVFISSRFWLLKIKPTADISYGVYLWGWPVQQVMAQQFPQLGIAFNQFSSIVISALLGYVSWRFVESRFINLARTLEGSISTKTSNVIKKSDTHAEIL